MSDYSSSQSETVMNESPGGSIFFAQTVVLRRAALFCVRLIERPNEVVCMKRVKVKQSALFKMSYLQRMTSGKPIKHRCERAVVIISAQVSGNSKLQTCGRSLVNGNPCQILLSSVSRGDQVIRIVFLIKTIYGSRLQSSALWSRLVNMDLMDDSDTASEGRCLLE